MSNLFNLIIGVLIFLFFITVGWGFLKSSDFVNQQTAKAKSGMESIQQKGQSIAELPKRTKADVEDQVSEHSTENTSQTTTPPAASKTAEKSISSTSNTLKKDKEAIPKETVEVTNITANSPTDEAPKPAPSPSETAPYMIITGSFSQAINADKELKKLQNLGYPNAKSIYLGTTQYKTVVAGYYNSLSDAQAANRQLLRQGIKEAYVHQRRAQK